MDGLPKRTNIAISKRLNNIGANALRRSTDAILRPESSSRILNSDPSSCSYTVDNLAPVMPAIDAVQQLEEEEKRRKSAYEKIDRQKRTHGKQHKNGIVDSKKPTLNPSEPPRNNAPLETQVIKQEIRVNNRPASDRETPQNKTVTRNSEAELEVVDTNFDHMDIKEEDSFEVRNNPLSHLIKPRGPKKNEDYEFIPKSVILDVYSNDPEVKRFLKQLTRIANEFGYNEQDYKCYSCRRPVGMVFGQSRLCHYDGHHYCTECHLGDKSTIPARILCNWDFTKYPISKRNQHFLNLISNEPMFELRTAAPLLYRTCPDLKELEELRSQAFFIRSYCFTCVQDSISFELTKLVWPREHLIKQTGLYSFEDLIQIKSGALKQVLKNVISFGRQHVLSCVLCRQKGFICELCKSSQIIYPFDTESVYRCNSCQSIYHKTCFKSKTSCDECPRCLRLKARRNNS